MALVWEIGAVLNIASGALIALFGVLLLLTDPRRDWNRVFGAFALFWGAQIGAINVVRITTDPDTARFAAEMSLAFLVPLYFFIISFASVFPRPRPPFGTSSLAVAALALPAAATIGILFVAPDLLIESIAQSDGGTYTVHWGSLMPFLVTAPFFGSLFYVLFLFMRRLDEAASPIERRQITFVLAALALFLAYATPVQLILFGGEALDLGTAPEARAGEAELFALIMLVSLALLALLTARLVARARDASEQVVRREARAIVAVIAVAFGAALSVEALGALGGPSVEALGPVRMGSVALIVFAVARYQLFDMDLRAKQVLAGATVALSVLAVGAAAWMTLRATGVSIPLRTVIVGSVAIVAFWPLLRAVRGLADRLAPHVSGAGDHLFVRKLEVYRAAMEQALAEGREATLDDAALAGLRRKLGLSSDDHRLVLALPGPTPAGPSSDGLVPGVTAFGKYEIESLLAEGGFGRVFLARDKVLGRPVVVKELLAKWRENDAVVQTFLREARIAGQLSHPNIVSVYGVERRGGDHFLILEYVPGGSLEERLRSGPLPLSEAITITMRVLDALDAAHAHGVVHRDVKPGNVLLGEKGAVKLTDFGIAELLGGDASRTVTGLTTQRPQAGTLVAMSPEQARGQPVDQRSDVYATGAMLYRLLAGRAHVDMSGKDEFAARMQVAQAVPPAPVAGAPHALNAVLLRALAPRPEDRFQSAADMAKALAEAAQALA